MKGSARTATAARDWAPFVATAILAGAGGALHLAGAASSGDGLWSAAAAVGGAYALWSMVSGLRHGHVGVDVIAALALVGAVAVGEHLAGAVIALMVTTGRALEGWADRRAGHDLRALLERAPTTARRYRPDGELESVALDDVVVGDRLLAGTGEVVPADGVLRGAAVLDESALTGEALPVERCEGDPVRSGVVNAGSPFELVVSAAGPESTYAGLVRLTEEAAASRAPFVRLADRVALGFLVLSVLAAALAWYAAGPARAVAVLVVATPCPLILAAPVAFVSGLARAARRGIVVKSGSVLERLARCTTVLVDKTGTLTAGRPAVVGVESAGDLGAEEILRLAASLDQVSPHVLAAAIVHAAKRRGISSSLPDQVEEIPGLGIAGRVEGRRVAVGKASWVGLVGSPDWARRARRRARLDGSLTVFVGVDGEPAGVLVLDDRLRPDAARTVRALRRSGIDRVVMVSGDRSEVAEAVGAVIGVDEVFADRAPAEKLEIVRAEQRRAPTIMVGDGVNDAPALALADVGVALGARGATASSEAADVVLSVDRLDRVGEARELARRVRDIAWQSVVAGMTLSLGAMAAAGLGMVPAVWGAILQEGIDVAVMVNALRALRPPQGRIDLDAASAALTRRFRSEHLSIAAAIERVREAADELEGLPPARALALARQVHRLLVDEVVPHEEAEQEVLYPALDRLLGGHDPTGPMSRAHAEITHRVRRLGRLLDDIGPEGLDAEDVADLRRVLHGLHAVLELHTAQEDESYLSLDEDVVDAEASPPRGARSSASAALGR